MKALIYVGRRGANAGTRRNGTAFEKTSLNLHAALYTQQSLCFLQLVFTTPQELKQEQDLRHLLLDLVAKGRPNEAVELAVGLYSELRDQNTHLNLRLAKALRARFGRSSEKLDLDQLALLLESAPEPSLEGAGASPERGPAREMDESEPGGSGELNPAEAGKKKKRKGGGRKPFPDHLPREIISLRVPEAERACKGCGVARVTIGKDCSEVLEFVPAQLKVLVYEREKVACAACGEGGVSVAPAPTKVIEKGIVGPSLLAQIIVSKHNDHLPLYRQREIFKRDGIDLPRATMGRWGAMAADLTQPLAERIKERVLASFVVQTDDTHLRVLDRDHPNGVVRGAVWAYIGDGELVSFDYTPSRKEKGPLAYLRDRRGYIQADAYTGYNKLFEGDSPPCIEVACMAHMRRYFYDALASGDPRAAWPLRQIVKLYEVEREARDLLPEVRAKLREERAGPLLSELGNYVHERLGNEPPKSPFGEALVYATNQWKALCRYLEDGRLDIDNTRVERLMRMIAVGRKNYLFAGSDAAAHRACVHYTLICSARLSRLDPRAYLTDIYQRLADGWPQRRIDELLPAAWSRSHPEAIIATRPA